MLSSRFSETDNNDNTSPAEGSAVFLVIDEESIDNGNEPNDFSETDVNDQLADIGLRTPLRYFQENIGNSINLPRVRVKILDTTVVRDYQLKLFENAPVPASSSEPFDINPPASVPNGSFIDAD